MYYMSYNNKSYENNAKDDFVIGYKHQNKVLIAKMPKIQYYKYIRRSYIMPKDNITIAEILENIQKNIQKNYIDLQTWERYFMFYYQASNTMGLDLENLIKLNRILSDATVTDIQTTEDEIRFKLEGELLKNDLPRLNSTLNYFRNAFDDNGFIKPEWVITEEQKKKMLYNNDPEIVEKRSTKR